MKVISLFILALGMFSLGHSQSIKRQSIGALGGTYQSNSLTIQYTVGQAYKTDTYYKNSIGHMPGFIQSTVFRLAYSPTASADLPININVFPNPSRESVSFITEKELDDLGISVYDMKGNIVYQAEVEHLSSYTLDCSQWPNGMYLIFLKEGSGNVYRSKFIKTR